MVGEGDAEEVEDFAFVPVGTGPDAGYRVDRWVAAGESALQAEAGVVPDRVEQVNDFEARFLRIPIESGDAGGAVESMFVAQKGADFDDVRRSDVENGLFVFESARFNGGAEALNECRDEGVILQ